ncbi:unnamed protein product [Paramecium sonneborni]|uniref:Uncharacterized protein n=1 Tax=Paramecium sonneborni TaxID=65129 RepID=A0A8S1NXE3_9CILI|nr:unnamed protein product [Paramecium sonneborni]
MYSLEQITKIRQLINNYLYKAKMFDKLKNKIENLDNELLIQLLREVYLIHNHIQEIDHLYKIDYFNKQNRIVRSNGILNFHFYIQIVLIFNKKIYEFTRATLAQILLNLIFLNCNYNQDFVNICIEQNMNLIKLFLFYQRIDTQKINVFFVVSKLNHLCIIQIKNKKKITFLKILQWSFQLCFGNIKLKIICKCLQSNDIILKNESFRYFLIQFRVIAENEICLTFQKHMVSQLSREQAIKHQILD